MPRSLTVVCILASLASAAVSASQDQEAPGERGATEADYGWWRDARFGIFIHWGPGAFVHRNSLTWQKPPADRPSWGELGYMADVKDPDRVPQEVLNGGYKKYQGGGSMPPAIYNNLYRIFNPVKFDANEVAQMAVDAGAGYIIFVTKHHDGFCMWDSAYTDYDMMSTPSKRDVCKELADACHKRGIRLIWYYSKVDMHDARHDVTNPKPYDDYLYHQIEELMTKYAPIEGIWWDGGRIKVDTVRLFKMMNRMHPGCLTNGRIGKVPFGISFGSPEQRLGSFSMGRPWETCAVIHSSSWIWNGGKDIKSLRDCLQMLIGCAVGDGNLALNYGPAPDGSIHPEVKANYLGMGRFLKKYGQSIYKTRGGPYKPDRWGGSTRRDKTVYLHVTQRWPIGVLKLPALPAKVLSGTSLTGGTPKFRQTKDGLEIRLDPKEHDPVDTIFALTLDTDAMTIRPIDTERSGTLTTNATVTASSSINPRSKRGAPETVVNYTFETGKFTRHFGEESHDKRSRINTAKKRPLSKDRIERLRKLIGTNHRGHFWRFWMPKKGDKQPWLEVDLGNPETFSKVGITELYGKVRSYELQHHDGSRWKTFYRDAGSIDRLTVYLARPVTAQRVRLVITETNGQLPTIVAFDLVQ